MPSDEVFDYLVEQQRWLLQEFRFRWVAIKDGGVADSDEDLDQLLDRISSLQAEERIALWYAYSPEDTG